MLKKYPEYRIICLDKLTYAGNLENLKDIENRENYTFVKADICDKEAISKIFEENDIDFYLYEKQLDKDKIKDQNNQYADSTGILGGNDLYFGKVID